MSEYQRSFPFYPAGYMSHRGMSAPHSSNVSGFSVTNLKYMKRFFEFYKGDSENRQQAVDDLKNICSVPNYGRKKGSGN